MNKRLKRSMVYSFIASLIASFGWYFYVLYTGKVVPDLLEETIKSGLSMFFVLTVFSYIKQLRLR